uniref:Uncharacterized protein n=1 Tax=Oryza brachyantha TaxID=4533 RepID=J3LV27_ORYBR
MSAGSGSRGGSIPLGGDVQNDGEMAAGGGLYRTTAAAMAAVVPVRKAAGEGPGKGGEACCSISRGRDGWEQRRRFQSNLEIGHWKAVKKVLRFSITCSRLRELITLRHYGEFPLPNPKSGGIPAITFFTDGLARSASHHALTHGVKGLQYRFAPRPLPVLRQRRVGGGPACVGTVKVLVLSRSSSDARLLRVLPFLGLSKIDPRGMDLLARPGEAHSRSTAGTLSTSSEALARPQCSDLSARFCTHCLALSLGRGTIVEDSAV